MTSASNSKAPISALVPECSEVNDALRSASAKQATPVTGYSYEQFRRMLEADWELEPAAIQLLRRYFLRKWHTSNLLPLINEGCLNFEGVNYQVRWIGGKVQATSQRMVALSFRLTYDSQWPIVLVKMTSSYIPNYYP